MLAKRLTLVGTEYILFCYIRAFDVELLYIAQKLKIPIGEVAVTWTEIEGSKVTPVLSWIQMGIDLFAIWLRYSTGRWQLVTDKKDN